jgi:hypothetical protein
MSPILRHFPQDEAVSCQKNTINWGFFDIWAEKHEKSGFFDVPRMPKTNGPRRKTGAARQNKA